MPAHVIIFLDKESGGALNDPLGFLQDAFTPSNRTVVHTLSEAVRAVKEHESTVLFFLSLEWKGDIVREFVAAIGSEERAAICFVLVRQDLMSMGTDWMEVERPPGAQLWNMPIVDWSQPEWRSHLAHQIAEHNSALQLFS